MWHILSFQKFHKTKGIFFVLPLGGFFLELQLRWIEFWFYLMVMQYCLEKPVVVTLKQLRLNLSSLGRQYKNKSWNIRMIYEANNRWVHNPSGGFFTVCNIIMYGLEYFRCMRYGLSGIIYVILLPSYWDFTVLRYMVHQPCNW